MAGFDRARRVRSYLTVAVVGVVLVLGAAAPQYLAPGVGLGRRLATAPTTVPPTTVPPINVPPTTLAPLADAIVAALNAARAEVGLGPCEREPALDALAASLVQHIAVTGQLEHNDLDAALADPEMGAFRSLGESLYEGPASVDAAKTVDSFLSRPTHRANLLTPRFDSVGIAVAVRGDAVTVVVDLAASW